MNIQSMYADIDLDATGMEVEFRSGLEKLLYLLMHILAIWDLEILRMRK